MVTLMSAQIVTCREGPQCTASRPSNHGELGQSTAGSPARRGGASAAALPVAGKGVSLRSLSLNLRVLATPENGFV